MHSPICDYLNQVLQQCHGPIQGQLADYIPELAQADPQQLALALATIDGSVYSTGDDDAEFTIQSMSKPFAYAYSLQALGFDAVLAKVGVEPSGEAFNQISLDEDNTPKNPMINSGAITIHSLLPKTGSCRAETLRQFLSQLAGRELSFDEQVYQSELKTAFRNLSIGYMLRSVEVLEQDPVEVVEGYIRQCAIQVTVKDLARMSSVLANGGVHPHTGEQILSRQVVRQVLSVMMSCGMYDAAGDWLTTVGIPAKSGVAGGIIGVLPAQVGIAVFSPPLDEHGNSVRGIDIFERLSADMGLHLMEGSATAQTIIQRHYHLQDPVPMVVYELRGALQFAEAERLLRALEAETVNHEPIVFDLNDISLIHAVGSNMLLEAIDRLIQDGHEVIIIDAEQILTAKNTHQGTPLKVYPALEHYLQTLKSPS